MDKMRNKIFVGCLALLLVMVVGYALFSQNLNISGTATAKGDFQVTPTCQPGIPTNLVSSAKSFFTQLNEAWVDENAYYDDSCTVSGNNINFQSSFKYPGARRYFTIKVTNTGSITAIPSHDYHNDSGEFCVDNNSNDTFDSNECFTDSSSLSLGVQAFDLLAEYDSPFAIEDKDGTIYDLSSTEEQLAKFLTDDGEFKLDAGVSAYYLIGIGFNSKLGEDMNEILAKINISSKITYSQPSA